MVHGIGVECIYCLSPTAPQNNSITTTPKTECLPFPSNGDLAAFESHLQQLPTTDDPRMFGLHPNASVALNKQEARRIIDAILSLQPRVVAVAAAPASGGGGGGSPGQASGGPPQQQQQQQQQQQGAADEGALAARVDEMLHLLRAQLSFAAASVLRDPFAALPNGAVSSLGTVLRQEVCRYNVLLGVVAASLTALGRALRGLEVMSSELEEAATSIALNKVRRYNP